MPLVSLANGKPQQTLLKAMPVPAGPFDMRFLGHAILGYAVPGHAVPGHAVPGFLETGPNDVVDPRGEHLDKRLSNRSNMSNMSDSAATTLRLESP